MVGISKIAKKYYPTIKKIIHLTTGGTIDSKAGEGRRPEGGIKNLADISKRLGVSLLPKEVFSLDSSNIGIKEICKIYEAVVTSLKERLPICITHGTDTLEFSAYILSFSLSRYLQVPVVLTGSHSPPDARGSDAAVNFHNALLVAGREETPPFVYAVFGRKIHLGSLVQKVKTMPEENGDYFVSRGGCVGYIEENGKISFSTNFLSWANSFSKTYEDPPSSLSLATISILTCFCNTGKQHFEDYLGNLLKLKKKGREVGLLVTGQIPQQEGVLDVIRSFIERGVPTFGIGFPEGWRDYGVIQLPSCLSENQAWAKLSVAMPQSKERGKLEEELNKDLAGEVELGKNCREVKFELLRITPSTTPNEIGMAIERLKAQGGDPKYLIIEGFGDGHLRVGEKSSGERIEQYLLDIRDGRVKPPVFLSDETKKELCGLVSSGSLKEKKLSEIRNEIRERLGALPGSESNADLLIKEALCYRSKILSILRDAIEKHGIRVIMHTQVGFSKPNLKLYDIGNMLEAIGVKPSDSITLDELMGKLELRSQGFNV